MWWTGGATETHPPGVEEASRALRSTFEPALTFLISSVPRLCVCVVSFKKTMKKIKSDQSLSLVDGQVGKG